MPGPVRDRSRSHPTACYTLEKEFPKDRMEITETAFSRAQMSLPPAVGVQGCAF